MLCYRYNIVCRLYFRLQMVICLSKYLGIDIVQVALITGGGSGIGFEISRQLGERASIYRRE